jgi:hypothetical protein
MADRPARVVRFIGAELEEVSRARCRARVALQIQSGETCAGTVEVEGACSDLEALRSVAQAAAEALTRAVGGKGGMLEVDGVSITEPFGKRTVFVAISARFGSQHRRLMGFSLIDSDPARATALAVLNATNRFLGVG